MFALFCYRIHHHFPAEENGSHSQLMSKDFVPMKFNSYNADTDNEVHLKTGTLDDFENDLVAAGVPADEAATLAMRVLVGETDKLGASSISREQKDGQSLWSLSRFAVSIGSNPAGKYNYCINKITQNGLVTPAQQLLRYKGKWGGHNHYRDQVIPMGETAEDQQTIVQGLTDDMDQRFKEMLMRQDDHIFMGI